MNRYFKRFLSLYPLFGIILYVTLKESFAEQHLSLDCLYHIDRRLEHLIVQ